MLYDFVLTNGHDRGSIIPIRSYKSSKLNDMVLGNVHTIIDQALEATGLLTEEVGNLYVGFGPAWVEKEIEYDEKTNMLLGDNWFLFDEGSLKTKNAREIAKQILTDLASTDLWENRFEGNSDSFSTLDFDKFSFIDTRVNNDNLKVAIGELVYVRGRGDGTYTYKGRPDNANIKDGVTIAFVEGGITATDSNIIASSDFSVNDYMENVEVFPLPVTGYFSREMGKNRYFARAKVGNKVTHESLGKTQKEAKTRLALVLAFEKMPTE